MGTNYFLTKRIGHLSTEMKFGIDAPQIHIGKFSAGWLFIFRYHEAGPKSINEYRDAISDAIREGWTLEDEYGSRLTLLQFMECVWETKHSKVELHGDDFLDQYGWPFIKGEFF